MTMHIRNILIMERMKIEGGIRCSGFWDLIFDHLPLASCVICKMKNTSPYPRFLCYNVERGIRFSGVGSDVSLLPLVSSEYF